ANGWAWEAQWAASTWRAESWRDYEMYDGGESAWTATDLARFEDAGVDPVHINRTFPTLNMLLGSQIVNRFEMIAKARTQQDGQISQVMSEGIKFIMDQADGEYLITTAFANAVIPGIGCLSPGLNEDPRKETLTIKLRDWKEIWWDPFSPPWWTPTKTRFVMWQRWADLDDIKAIFHEKRKQIDDAYNEISGANREHGYSALMDEAQHVEEHIRSLSASEWIDTERKRIRPIEMWYPVNELCMFALYPDGRCYEIRKDMDELEAFQAIQGSQQVLRSIVKKMRVMTFFGEHLILQDEPSPYNHDQYPLIPFVGYLDRYG
ncbi:MAG: hypothetical protein GY849_11225, partial [Deltaproteobacteria bacterium]|nr:hypothetical protein [Deltaproteobacteria bacterium]